MRFQSNLKMTIPFVKTVALSWLLFFGIFNYAEASDRMKSPFGTVKGIKNEKQKAISVIELSALIAIKFYSSVISPADGPRSPSYPTGTAYGRNAIRKHGFLKGVLLIGDRLFHEADIHQGPMIILHGKQRYYDPVESNTFWWSAVQN